MGCIADGFSSGLTLVPANECRKAFETIFVLTRIDGNKPDSEDEEDQSQEDDIQEAYDEDYDGMYDGRTTGDTCASPSILQQRSADFTHTDMHIPPPPEDVHANVQTHKRRRSDTSPGSTTSMNHRAVKRNKIGPEDSSAVHMTNVNDISQVTETNVQDTNIEDDAAFDLHEPAEFFGDFEY